MADWKTIYVALLDSQIDYKIFNIQRKSIRILQRGTICLFVMYNSKTTGKNINNYFAFIKLHYYIIIEWHRL